MYVRLYELANQCLRTFTMLYMFEVTYDGQSENIIIEKCTETCRICYRSLPQNNSDAFKFVKLKLANLENCVKNAVYVCKSVCMFLPVSHWCR